MDGAGHVGPLGLRVGQLTEGDLDGSARTTPCEVDVGCATEVCFGE